MLYARFSKTYNKAYSLNVLNMLYLNTLGLVVLYFALFPFKKHIDSGKHGKINLKSPEKKNTGNSIFLAKYVETQGKHKEYYENRDFLETLKFCFKNVDLL